MNKLNKKLAISISLVVVVVSMVNLYLNKTLIHRYYLHEKKKVISKVGEEVESLSIKDLIDNINSLEKQYNVSIVYTPINIDKDSEEDITKSLLNELNKKDISPKRFWISNPRIEEMKHGSVNEIYNQGDLKYSLLMKFILKDDYIVTTVVPIEHSEETMVIVNQFNLLLTSFSVIVIVILTFILSKKIIDPLEKIKLLSQDIEKLNFRTEDINTNDEIEELAKSVNQMSMSLESAHNELNRKNENLKTFIGGASHELKTPIALIKAYSMGIKDGIDDGTYIDTIIEQSEKMDDIINNLLYLSKREKRDVKITSFDLRKILYEVVEDYKLIINESNIDLKLNITSEEIIINSDEEGIKIVLDNLISNAIKYTTDNTIHINLVKDEVVALSIKNKANNKIEKEIENIWQPFYVLEKSRNKQLSGTGLGLSLVKGILDVLNLKYGVDFKDEYINFFIEFK